jgi:serine/threonine protein kinase
MCTLSHRNVLLDTNMVAKIADFGLCTNESESTHGAGTPHWAAPEVLHLMPNIGRCDPYTPYDKRCDYFRYIFTHTHPHPYMCVCVHVCMYLCTYVRMCVCVFIYIYIYIYTCIHTYNMHIRIHTCMHACIHTYRHTYTPKFTHTYSYGVLLYEFFHCRVPYCETGQTCPELLGKDILFKQIRPRLSRECPREITLLVKKCWQAEPDTRPSFKQVCMHVIHTCMHIMYICMHTSAC